MYKQQSKCEGYGYTNTFNATWITPSAIPQDRCAFGLTERDTPGAPGSYLADLH